MRKGKCYKIGAINIARVINNAREYFTSKTNIATPRVPVFWSYGKGEDSFTVTGRVFEVF